MRGAKIGLFFACVVAGQASAAESASDVIRTFGLIGSWSVDCQKDPRKACDQDSCGARLTYIVPSSGPPIINLTNRTYGKMRTFISTIYSASRIAEDKIKFLSVQDPPPSLPIVWWRQPGEVWEIVLLKVGDKYRTFSAHRDDGKKFDVEEGFYVRPPPPPPPAESYNTMPTEWHRTTQQTPLFEKCSD
jgi:hypothetical protein